MLNRVSLRLFRLALVIAAASLCLAACGQKGPLYLPEEPQDPPAEEEAAAQES